MPLPRIAAALISSAAALAATLALGVPSAAAAGPRDWHRADESIQCDTTPGGSHFYDGDSASATYNRHFTQPGAEIPKAFLDSYVPQGLGAWTNWDGKGHDLRLISGYHDGARSALIGIVVNGGPTHTASIPASHVGGVAVIGSWLFISGGATKDSDGKTYPVVQRYSLSAARSALMNGGTLNPVHTAILKVGGTYGDGYTNFKASFLGKYGSTLYVGMFDMDNRNRMYSYTVASNGDLQLNGSADDWIQVPKKTQGLAVTSTKFFFSTSSGRESQGNIYVVNRTGNRYLDADYPQDLYCFQSPSLNEGAAIVGSNLYLVYESGSFEYRDSARNKIDHLHYAPVAGF